MSSSTIDVVPIWDCIEVVRVISLSTLRSYWQAKPDAEEPLRRWYTEAIYASWASPAELKEKYRSASILKNGRVVFNIDGNKYRLIVAVLYESQIVFIKFVGTHEEYDKVDAQIVER